MASAFAHIVVPVVIYASFKSASVNPRLLTLACLLSILPDVDVISFSFAVPYESQWGHRGFTHSLMFSGLLALLSSLYARHLHSKPLTVFLICFVASASHAALDAMTNGGLGVAFYWPFNAERIFLSYRPIQVSPIGIGAFFTSQGLKVISSELVWVFLPGLLLAVLGYSARRMYEKRP